MREGNREGGGRDGGGRDGRSGGRDSGGRGGRSRGGRGRGGGGYRGGRGRSGGGDRGDLLRSAESGNKRERVAVESGFLVVIDQFMLANPQLIAALSETVDASLEKKDAIIARFGGCTVEVAPGTYRIERDPFALSIIIHLEGEAVRIEDVTSKVAEKQGELFVDTRCLAMIDRELLDDTALLEKYQQLWFSGQDKACRDLIRDNGGAVRYGFQRTGDELIVSRLAGQNVVCLWPEGGPLKVAPREERSDRGDNSGSNNNSNNNSDERDFEARDGAQSSQPAVAQAAPVATADRADAESAA